MFANIPQNPSSSLFSENISKIDQKPLFGLGNKTPKKEKKEEQKNNITSSLFNNDKPSLFGDIIGQNTNQNNEKKINSPFFQKNINVTFLKPNLFENMNKDANNNDSNIIKQDKGNLFKNPFNEKIEDKNEKEKENKLFTNDTNNQKNGSPQITKNLFTSNNLIKINIPEKEDKKEKEIGKNNNNIFIQNNVNTEKKNEQNEEQKEKKLFEISTKSNPLQNNSSSINVKSKINTTISTNQSANLTSTRRIEDDDQVQNALQNLYVSDILLPSKFNHSISFKKNSKDLNSNKISKTIDFKFFIKIKGMPDIDKEGYNMICQSNESMSKLVKQAHAFVKKKYKMTKEQNDFDIILMKNEKILTSSNNELIGKYIKNNDKIIIYLIHNYSNHTEKELYEKNELENIEIKNEQNEIEKKEEINEISFRDENNKKEYEYKVNEIGSLSENINENENQNKKLSSSYQFNNENNLNFKKTSDNILCPTDKLPILKRKGYFMTPDEYTISRMTIYEINNITNFSIFNENGKIEFEGKVSLYNVNLDKLFNIEHELIEYEKGEWSHSPRGTNFNIPAIITFYNVKSNVNELDENEKNIFLEKLKSRCKKHLNAEFISYDFNKGTLKYKIPYFY